MKKVDLSTTPVRELNQALHALGADTNETHWRVVNPKGQHAIAVGLSKWRLPSRWLAKVTPSSVILRRSERLITW